VPGKPTRVVVDPNNLMMDRFQANNVFNIPWRSIESPCKPKLVWLLFKAAFLPIFISPILVSSFYDP
jgi:hypothetical protein